MCYDFKHPLSLNVHLETFLYFPSYASPKINDASLPNLFSCEFSSSSLLVFLAPDNFAISVLS